MKAKQSSCDGYLGGHFTKNSKIFLSRSSLKARAIPCLLFAAACEHKWVRRSVAGCRAARSWQAASCWLPLLMEASSWTEDRCLLLAHRQLKSSLASVPPPSDSGSCTPVIYLSLFQSAFPTLATAAFQVQGHAGMR